jgi:hypothetical protein
MAGSGGFGFRRVYRRYGQTILIFVSALQSVTMVGWEGLFQWRVVEGGDATLDIDLFQILVSYNQFHYNVLY